jgi:hypothetical protein
MMQSLLMVMMDAAPGCDGDFNDWANREHMPERRNLPGFQTALRFRNTTGSPQYLALYDLDDISVLQSEAYLAISGPNLSPWSKRILAGARNRWRFEGSLVREVAGRHNTGAGDQIAEILLVRWRGVAKRCDPLVLQTLALAVAQSSYVVRARAFYANRGEQGDYIGLVESTKPFSPDSTEHSRYDLPGNQMCDFAQIFSPL